MSNLEEKVEESEEEMRKKVMTMRKQVEGLMRNGAALVRESNGLPKAGADFELYNSYPTFNTFMKRSEERLNALMSRLTKSIGCAMRVPDVGSSVQHYTECVIEGQDNIAERAATLHEVLKKANRDDIVKVPEFILKAAPTNRKTEAEISAAMRTFSANIGTVLAQKFRERREEAAQMIVHEKPQKTYGIGADNSMAPFSTKMRQKHHAIEKRTGLVVIDDDESGKRQWSSTAEETEEEHPYLAEIMHFKVPAHQLQSAESEKFKPLGETPLTMVDTKEKLEALRDKLNDVKEFSIDLEHNETRSYLGLTCLIQISTRDEDFIVDPFPIWEHVGILNEPFTNPNILKVLHGCDNDVLWLQRDFGVHIVNLFDTYVAMKKLKFPKYGLAYLVLRFADVVLDKQYQLADWRARPLRNAMMNYAREDTHYLLYCYDMLREQLLQQEPKDLADVYSECSDLCVRVYKKPVFNPKGYMTDIRFRFTLNSRQDYALTHLYKWRDMVARSEDESPQFVLPNHMLLALSETLPRDVGGIYACCNPLPHFVKQRTGDIFKIIVEAREVKLEKLEPTAKEMNDVQEARGVMNDTMDQITSILRSKIDFSHTRFDEERGEIEIDKSEESSAVTLKKQQDSLLSVLQPSTVPNNEEAMIVVEKGKQADRKNMKQLVNELDKFVTPFECYQMMMITKQKQEEEERKEAEKKKLEEGEGPKTMFSHLDPTVNRKPEYDARLLNVETIKLEAEEAEKSQEPSSNQDEPPVFDSSRFSDDQLMSKKAMKRKRQAAKRNIDVSVVLGESSTSDPKKKKPEEDIKVEEFDYEKEDSSVFEKPIRDNNADFDPFHQKFRVKNKSKKNMAMKKSSNRQGTINYKK